MYFDGDALGSSLDDGADATEYYMTASEVRVVTFDLDNCLWKTGATISAANEALAAFLDEYNITQPVRVEKVMGELFKENSETYSPSGGKAPVLLTALRKDAIKRVLQDHNEYSEEEARNLADEAFDVWTKTRHDVIPSHFASSVVECLETIRSLPTSSGQPIFIGAVTDGNSDPRNVHVLSDFFDFCVNAESVGVAKPDRRMYVEAIRIVTEHPSVQDIFGSIQLSEEAIEDIIGPWWVHVGDDFMKDVVPAKELKMRSIWARELILTRTETKKDEVTTPKKSMEEFVKEVADKKVIEMAIGADDYLVDSLRREFADAVVDSFGELGGVIADWQQEALRRASEGENKGEDEEAELEIVPVEEMASLKTPAGKEKAVDGATKKFCMYCGVKLPMAAKFCSSCGEKQPDIEVL